METRRGRPVPGAFFPSAGHRTQETPVPGRARKWGWPGLRKFVRICRPAGQALRVSPRHLRSGTPHLSQAPLMDPAVFRAKQPPDKRRGESAMTTVARGQGGLFRHWRAVACTVAAFESVAGQRAAQTCVAPRLLRSVRRPLTAAKRDGCEAPYGGNGLLVAWRIAHRARARTALPVCPGSLLVCVAECVRRSKRFTFRTFSPILVVPPSAA
jgi:hypothetical protein